MGISTYAWLLRVYCRMCFLISCYDNITQAHNVDIQCISKGCFSTLIKVAEIELAERDITERRKLRYLRRRASKKLKQRKRHFSDVYLKI